MSETTGLTKDAGWQIGVSKVTPFAPEQVWQFLVKHPELWLGDGVVLPVNTGDSWQATDGSSGELRSFHPNDRIRLTWLSPESDHESTVQVTVSMASGGTTLRFHQERMASAAERAAQRKHWQWVIETILDALERSASTEPRGMRG